MTKGKVFYFKIGQNFKNYLFFAWIKHEKRGSESEPLYSFTFTQQKKHINFFLSNYELLKKLLKEECFTKKINCNLIKIWRVFNLSCQMIFPQQKISDYHELASFISLKFNCDCSFWVLRIEIVIIKAK